MAASVFDDKSKEPDRSDLDAALGETAPLLRSVENYIAEGRSVRLEVISDTDADIVKQLVAVKLDAVEPLE